MARSSGPLTTTSSSAGAGQSATTANNKNSQQQQQQSNKRLERTTACLPIVYGSIAFYLGKKADEYQTHQWTLYVRGPNGDEDLSQVISKVIFQLHASFAQPLRELTEPPFEVTERGWGEFEAQIRIVWKDTTEKSTLVAHPIKLYPPGTPVDAVPDSEEPVIAESYDEVVFTDPTESFFQQLKYLSKAPPPSTEYSQQKHFDVAKYNDTETVHALIEAQKFIQEKLDTVKERVQQLDTELSQVDTSLREVVVQHQQEQQQQQQHPKQTHSSKVTTTKNTAKTTTTTNSPSKSSATTAAAAAAAARASSTTAGGGGGGNKGGGGSRTTGGGPPSKKAKTSSTK